MKITPKQGNQHGEKDRSKAEVANKFIGRGSARSSTQLYALQLKQAGYPVNCGIYSKEDVVFVSAEGDRLRRLSFDELEVGQAALSGATLVTDNLANRRRLWNVGEREVAEFLMNLGCLEQEKERFSYWRLKEAS